MPNISKVIKVTISGGVTGQPVLVRNRTTGETLSLNVESTGKLTLDLQNFTSGVSIGDVVDIKISGATMGSTSVTVSGDQAQTASFTATAITSGVARGIR